MITLSLFIAGRRRLCQQVDEPTLLRGLHAINDRMDALELQGRVVVTGEANGVVYIIPMQQEAQ